MNILVLALFRDAAYYAPYFLTMLDRATSSPDHHYEFAFYENDSTDNTVEVVGMWGRPHTLISEQKHFAKFGSCMVKERIKNLAYYRNTLVANSLKPHHDLVVWVNSDSLFASDVLDKLLAVDEWYNSEQDVVLRGRPHIVSGLSFYLSNPTRLWDWGATRTLGPSFPPLPAESDLLARTSTHGLSIFPPHFVNVKEQERFDAGMAVQVQSTYHEVCVYNADVFRSGCLFDGDESELEVCGLCRDVIKLGYDHIVVTPQVKVYERV